MSSAEPRLPLFAITAPGLEPIAERELRALGIAGAAEPGGVAWEGTTRELYEANLRLRTASRVVQRIATFRARSFIELERHADRVPWDRFLTPGRPVRLRTTAKKSRLYHERAIEQRLLESIERRMGVAPAPTPSTEEEDEGAAEQLFVVRFHRDVCTLSIDCSGALLHRRGYRQAVARAPLRETLAGAMLLVSGWDGRAPLLDPMCGSGTIPIEAALLARRIPPGLATEGLSVRRYAFQEWPGFEPSLWEASLAAARAGVLPESRGEIRGSDRDAGAIEAASSNAARAGVAGDVTFVERPASALEPHPEPGWLVTNPPYGVRVGETEALRNLYAALGRAARATLPGWTLAMLSAEPRLEAQMGIPFAVALRTRNGGIPVRVVVGRV